MVRRSADDRPNLVGMTHSELEAFFADVGKERYRATQVMKWIHQGLVRSFAEMTNLSKQLRSDLTDWCRIEYPKVAKISPSRPRTQ